MARAVYRICACLVLLVALLPLITCGRGENVFTLRSILLHGVDRDQARLLQNAISEVAVMESEDMSVRIKTRPIQIQHLADRRPSTIEPILAAARQIGPLNSHAWAIDTVPAPDVTDRDTVINFALMAANAYTLVPGTEDWEDLDKQFGFNTSLDFGWNSKGLRGHVYADKTNTTVIVAIKGTTRALWDGDETTTPDKENDNLYFACCCGQQGQFMYRPVCDCATSTYSCNSTCLEQNLREDHRYYQAARFLYSNVTEMYPNATVWVTGHSLGGSISSLLSLTYGLPAITFEAPGDALPASRLGIPTPPGSSYARQLIGTYHFGHTADPVYMGTCNGATATCTLYGYAFESQCHAGMMCTYDTVADHGWHVGIWTHGIRAVIRDVLRVYENVPECIVDDQCKDCYSWSFYESNSSHTMTSSSSMSTRTRTRTATCETPGWWSCRDETTSTQITTTRTSTSTCHTPGWFWCRDKSTTSSTMPVVTGPAHAIPSITHDITLPSPSKTLLSDENDEDHEL